MKHFSSYSLVAAFTFFLGAAPLATSFFGCARATMTESSKTYANEEFGYRLRYPESWKVKDWGAAVYFCSPRIKLPCGPTPHEVNATVSLQIRDPEGLPLADYLRSPARAYRNLRELRVGGVQAYATGPVEDDFGKFMDEQVHVLRGGKVYNIVAYAVDSSPKEFEEVLKSFEFTK